MSFGLFQDTGLSGNGAISLCTVPRLGQRPKRGSVSNVETPPASFLGQ
jgi:hypothetical protein